MLKRAYIQSYCLGTKVWWNDRKTDRQTLVDIKTYHFCQSRLYQCPILYINELKAYLIKLAATLTKHKIHQKFGKHMDRCTPI